MKKSEIVQGGEYAAVLLGHPDLSRGIAGYAEQLAHVRVVETDHEFDGRNSYHQKVKKRGYLVELVEDFRSRNAGSIGRDGLDAGFRRTLDTGRLIVLPWADYASALADHRAKQETARKSREASEARFERLREALSGRGITVDDPRQSWMRGNEITSVEVAIGDMEFLLGLGEEVSS